MNFFSQPALSSIASIAAPSPRARPKPAKKPSGIFLIKPPQTPQRKSPIAQNKSTQSEIELEDLSEPGLIEGDAQSDTKTTLTVTTDLDSPSLGHFSDPFSPQLQPRSSRPSTIRKSRKRLQKKTRKPWPPFLGSSQPHPTAPSHQNERRRSWIPFCGDTNVNLATIESPTRLGINAASETTPNPNLYTGHGILRETTVMIEYTPRDLSRTVAQQFKDEELQHLRC